jgi:hypothetical protein
MADSEKDQLIIQIAQQIASSPRLDPGWTSVSLVFTFEKDGLSNFGYAYLGNGQGDWKAFSTTSEELEDDVIRLREVMKDESKAAWKQALFQLIRASREMKFEFSYDLEERWKITPGNLDQMVRELQPH